MVGDKLSNFRGISLTITPHIHRNLHSINKAHPLSRLSLKKLSSFQRHCESMKFKNNKIILEWFPHAQKVDHTNQVINKELKQRARAYSRMNKSVALCSTRNNARISAKYSASKILEKSLSFCNMKGYGFNHCKVISQVHILNLTK